MRLLDLAPHCSLPPRDGGERRAWHLYEGLVGTGLSGKFIARDAIAEGLAVARRPLAGDSWRERKLITGLAAFISRRDYWQFKMLTSGIHREVAASADSFDTLLVHFLYSTALLRHFRGRRLRLLVDTHNYDPAVFAGFQKATRNPLARALCGRAIRTSQQALAALPNGTVLIHVSEADAIRYRADRPDLDHVVVENGGWATPRSSAPDYTLASPRQLVFVGSLSAQMNQDALQHLATNFWPALRDLAQLTVVGSNPSPAVAELCTREGWQLSANVSDAELDAAYCRAHYAVLPFSYGAGSKLKLLEACGRGVPVLATSAGITGIDPPPLVQVSDDPAAWRRTLERRLPPSEKDLRDTSEFSQRLSWPTLAARLAAIMHDAPLTTIS